MLAKSYHGSLAFRCWFLFLISSFCLEAANADKLTDTSREIAREAVLSADSAEGRPLPLAAHWNCGERPGGYSPEYQLKQISQGKHLLPWFYLMRPNESKLVDSYYENPIKEMAQLGLPVSFIGTQFEYRLAEEKKFLELPPELNPNLINSSGKLEKVLTPIAHKGPWIDAGMEWTNTRIIKKIQNWYPHPPLVLFISNNEQERLTGRDIDRSASYLNTYGRFKDEYFKHKLIGDGWINLYRALQGGMKAGLSQPDWKNNSKYIAYNAFESPKYGLFAGWHNYSLYYPGRFQPWPLAWDGTSVSYYLRYTDESSDHTLFSPQIESMNWIFMLEEAQQQNKRYWFELSTSDGLEPKRTMLSKPSQPYSPDRYRGMVQFGAWLLRPRVLREFRMWDDTVKHSESYFLAVTDTVDLIYQNEDLKRFWRKGLLVANPASKHPYELNIPPEYANRDRWFLLDASVNKREMHRLSTEVAVYALALTLGSIPNREWLIYAYSPLQDRPNVSVTIPGFGEVGISASIKGSFFKLSEKDGELVSISNQVDPAIPY